MPGASACAEPSRSGSRGHGCRSAGKAIGLVICFSFVYPQTTRSFFKTRQALSRHRNEAYYSCHRPFHLGPICHRSSSSRETNRYLRSLSLWKHEQENQWRTLQSWQRLLFGQVWQFTMRRKSHGARQSSATQPHARNVRSTGLPLRVRRLKYDSQCVNLCLLAATWRLRRLEEPTSQCGQAPGPC